MFTVTQVGSWPRSRELLMALRDKQQGRMPDAEFQRLADDEVRRCLACQHDAGVEDTYHHALQDMLFLVVPYFMGQDCHQFRHTLFGDQGVEQGDSFVSAEAGKKGV